MEKRRKSNDKFGRTGKTEDKRENDEGEVSERENCEKILLCFMSLRACLAGNLAIVLLV